jgi:hypothetical protein
LSNQDKLEKAGQSSAIPHRASFARELYALKPPLAPSPAFLHASLPVDKVLVEQNDELDHNNIILNWRTVADAYGEILKARQAKKTNEFAIRRGVDTLLVTSAGVSQGTVVRCGPFLSPVIKLIYR